MSILLDLAKLATSSTRGGYSKNELLSVCTGLKLSYVKSWNKAKLVHTIHTFLTGSTTPVYFTPSSPKSSSGGRQEHGKVYERKIIAEFNMTPTVSDTDEWDAYYGDYPVQIKFSRVKTNAMELADFFKFLTIPDGDFILIHGTYKNSHTHEETSRRAWVINGAKWKTLFTCSTELQKSIKDGLKSISNSYEDDQRWSEMVAQWKRKWGWNRVVSLNFKRDHKTQKRLQCNIKFSELDKFPTAHLIYLPNTTTTVHHE